MFIGCIDNQVLLKAHLPSGEFPHLCSTAELNHGRQQASVFISNL